MDELAAKRGAAPAWPSFDELDVAAVARGLGCEARRIERLDELLATFDDVLPGLREREEPLLLEIAVSA